MFSAAIARQMRLESGSLSQDETAVPSGADAAPRHDHQAANRIGSNLEWGTVMK
jgi:hypothetical protein